MLFEGGLQACDVISVGGPRFATKCDRGGGGQFYPQHLLHWD